MPDKQIVSNAPLVVLAVSATCGLYMLPPQRVAYFTSTSASNTTPKSAAGGRAQTTASIYTPVGGARGVASVLFFTCTTEQCSVSRMYFAKSASPTRGAPYVYVCSSRLV